MLNDLTAEARFLLQCIRLENNKTCDASPQGWSEIVGLAKRHSVLPLLYTGLTQSNVAVPTDVIEHLRAQAARIAGRNAILKRELVTILKLLQQNGFKILPYKGPLLTERLYGNIALRHFDDLDILVQKKDFAGIKALLQTNGFEPKKEISKMTRSQENAFLAAQYTYDFIHRNSKTPLEVHWAILPKSFSLDLDIESMWRRCSTVSFEGLTVPTFCPEDWLLILCIMGAKKSWERLSRVSDVARFLTVFPELDWNFTLQRAKETGAERILLVGLSLAVTLFDAPLSDAIKTKFNQDMQVSKITNEIVHGMFVPENFASRILRTDDQFQPMHYRIRERFADRLRYCYRLALTPGIGEWNAISLPGFAYWLYYPFRPFRLTLKAIRRLIASSPRENKPE